VPTFIGHNTHCSQCKKKFNDSVTYTIRGIDGEFCSRECQEAVLAERKKEWLVKSVPKKSAPSASTPQPKKGEPAQRKQKESTEKPLTLAERHHEVTGSRPKESKMAEPYVMALWDKHPKKAYSLAEILSLRGTFRPPDFRQAAWNLVEAGKLKYEGRAFSLKK
jgi:hypothetical protein